MRKNPFPQFESGKGMKKIRKREGFAKKAFSIFGIRKGMKSRPSKLWEFCLVFLE